MFLALCLALLPLSTGCPSGCACSPAALDERLDCSVGGVTFKAQVLYNDYAEITCLEGTLTCDVMPPIPVSPNRTLPRLSLDSCSIPRLSCLIDKMGATGVSTVTLRDARGELKAEHVEGLRGLENLYMFDAAHQTSVPYEVLSITPSLRYFILRGGNLTLRRPPAAISLTKLMLESDQIQEIPPGVFEGFENLTALFLAANSIRNISDAAFEGLSNLRSLDLSRNSLRSLARHVFAPTPRLVAVKLTDTHLTDVYAGLFTGLTHLEKIKISSRINLTLHPRAFAELPALQILTIEKTSLASLPPDLLSGSKAINTIEMNACSLTGIPSGLFEDQKRLEYLTLKENKIAQLGPGVFYPLTSLKTLDLFGNQIAVLPDHVFAGLGNLRTLNLGDNRLTTIGEMVFQGTRNLQDLILSGNQLTLMRNRTGSDMLESPFSKLYELEILDLSRNQISQVFDDWRLSFIHSIALIDLSWNQITKLQEKDTIYLGMNLTVDFRHNRISTIKIDRNHEPTANLLLGHNPYFCDCNLYSFINYTRTHSQAKLDLNEAYCAGESESKVSLEEIPLTSLTCSVKCSSNCNCTLVPADSSLRLDCTSIPDYYPNMTAYNATNLKLKLNSIQDPIILPSNVATLNLTKLALKTLPKIPNTIQELDLRYNKLSTIPKEVALMNISLFLAGNPLLCSCFHRDEIKMLLDARLFVKDANDVNCESGEAFFDINADHLCDTEMRVAILSVLLIIATVLIATVYFYAEELKLFIYRRGWNIFIYEEDVDGKEFDVLISYDEAKERLVFEKIVPKLEQLGYNVCVKYKHWDIGDFIPAVVAKTVSASRRVLVVISDNYIDSIAVLELKAARKCEDKDRRKRLLFVSVEELNPETKLHMKKNACLKFDDRRFWQRIQKHLPRKRVWKQRKSITQRSLNMMFSADGSVDFELIPKKIVDKPNSKRGK